MDCLLPLNKAKILRYLGYRKKQELSTELNAMIDKMIIKIQKIAKPRYHYQVFDFKVDEKNNKVKVLNTKLILTGQKIVEHLYWAKKMALLVATLGIEVERKYAIMISMMRQRRLLWMQFVRIILKKSVT